LVSVGWPDWNGVRVLGYLAVAVAAVFAGRREARRAVHNPNLWPRFWYFTAGMFLVMAFGRMANVAEILTDLGREEALATGWYDRRRRYQAMACGFISVAWFVTVFISIWRVPERRRRYLPMALITFSIICFAGIRLFSLHHIDALLYRRQLAGAGVGAVMESLGLLVAFAATFWRPRRRAHELPDAPRAPSEPQLTSGEPRPR
jgi:hypothetical protein